MLAMNRYVGIAKVRPASRIPRRLPYAMRMTKATAISTVYGVRDGTAEVRAETPAAIDTATVSV